MTFLTGDETGGLSLAVGPFRHALSPHSCAGLRGGLRLEGAFAFLCGSVPPASFRGRTPGSCKALGQACSRSGWPGKMPLAAAMASFLQALSQSFLRYQAGKPQIPRGPWPSSATWPSLHQSSPIAPPRPIARRGHSPNVTGHRHRFCAPGPHLVPEEQVAVDRGPVIPLIEITWIFHSSRPNLFDRDQAAGSQRRAGFHKHPASCISEEGAPSGAGEFAHERRTSFDPALLAEVPAAAKGSRKPSGCAHERLRARLALTIPCPTVGFCVEACLLGSGGRS